MGVKVIRDIIRSSHAPANKNVLWLDTSSKSPILMGWYRGEWAPVTSGDTGSMVKSVDLFELDSLLDSGELQPGEWVDITDSYLENIVGIRCTGSYMGEEALNTNWALVPNSNIECKYLIQVWEVGTLTYCGEGFFREKTEGQWQHMHFTLSKYDDPFCPIYDTNLRVSNQPYYIITESKILNTNSTFNFDPLVIAPINPEACIKLGYMINTSAVDGIGLREEQITCARAENTHMEVLRIPLTRIINSQIIIQTYYPIWDQNSTIVNSTIDDSILANNVSVSNSTIINSVVSQSTVVNSTMTNVLYGVGDASNFCEHSIYDWETDEMHTTKFYTSATLFLEESKISNVIFTPTGYDYYSDMDSPISTWSDSSRASLSYFDNFNLHKYVDIEGHSYLICCIIYWNNLEYQGHSTSEIPEPRYAMDYLMNTPIYKYKGEHYQVPIELSQLAASEPVPVGSRRLENIQIHIGGEDYPVLQNVSLIIKEI